jgi:hypothetical protein
MQTATSVRRKIVAGEWDEDRLHGIAVVAGTGYHEEHKREGWVSDHYLCTAGAEGLETGNVTISTK